MGAAHSLPYHSSGRINIMLNTPAAGNPGRWLYVLPRILFTLSDLKSWARLNKLKYTKSITGGLIIQSSACFPFIAHYQIDDSGRLTVQPLPLIIRLRFTCTPENRQHLEQKLQKFSQIMIAWCRWKKVPITNGLPIIH